MPSAGLPLPLLLGLCGVLRCSSETLTSVRVTSGGKIRSDAGEAAAESGKGRIDPLDGVEEHSKLMRAQDEAGSLLATETAQAADLRWWDPRRLWSWLTQEPPVQSSARYPLVGEENPFEKYFDGHSTGKGVWKWRHYFPAYERHLGKFRGRSDVHVAEVGIYSGGSLLMWQSVFGPDAQLYGIDIANSTKVFEADDATNHTHVFIGDQADPAFWDNFRRSVPKLDVLIDDGGHELQQMMTTLENVVEHLRPGGVFITEDIHGADNGFLRGALDYFKELHHVGPKDSDGKMAPSRMQDLVDSIHFYPYLLVVERRERPRGYLQAPKHGDVWNPHAVIR